MWGLVYRFPWTTALYQRLTYLLLRDADRVLSVCGQKVYVNPHRSIVEMRLMIGRTYEPEVVQFLGEFLRPGMTMIDIGANIGFFSLLAAGLVGPEGKVIAYEPHPRTHARICANIRLNGYKNIVPVALAISDKAGTVRISDRQDCALNTIMENGICDLQIEAQSLDDSLHALGINRCDLIKMDIEGAEVFAIQGMRQTLKRFPNAQLLIEVHLEVFRSSRWTLDAFLRFFTEQGYRLYELNMWHGRRPINVGNTKRIHGHLLCCRSSDV